MRILKATMTFGLGLVFSASAWAGTEYEVIDLGPGTGVSINDAGTVVGSPIYYGSDPWQWSSSSPVQTPLNSSPSPYGSYGSAINASGLIAGIYDDTTYAYDPDTWTDASFAATWKGGVMSDLSTADFSAEAWAVNSHGTVVGWIEPVSGDATEAAVSYGGGQMVNLNSLIKTNPSGLTLQIATGINDHGQIVGFATDSNGNYVSFLFSHGTVTETGPASAAAYYGAIAINNSGIVVGSYAVDANADTLAFSTGSALAALGVGDYSEAAAVNSAGVTVGYSVSGNAYGMSAVLWSPGGAITDLNNQLVNPAGWTLEDAYDINNSGQIVGTGIYDGNQEAFLLDPVPEPISMIFFGTGLVAVGGYVSRRRMLRKG